MRELRINKEKTSRYLFIMVFASFIIGCTPLFNNVYLYLLLWLIFLPYFFFSLQFEIHKHSRIIVCMLLWIFLILMYKLIGISTASWGRYIGYILSFIPFYLMLKIPQSIDLKHKKILFWLVVILMIFNIADSIRLSMLYPFLNVDNVRDYKDFVQTINLGGSAFYNYVLLFTITCYLILLNNDSKKVKIILFGTVILASIYMLFFTNKASTVLYYFMSIVLITFAKINTNKYHFFISLFVLLFVLHPLVELYEKELINLIISLSPSQRISIRLVALVSSNELDESTSIVARENYWMVSLNTWLSSIPNFIFGIGDHFTTGNSAKTGIGQHSEFLDSIARYGFVGLILLYYLLKKSFIYVNSMFNKEIRLQVFAIFVIYLVHGFTKQIFHIGSHSMFFLFLPIAVVYGNAKVRNNKISKFVKR